MIQFFDGLFIGWARRFGQPFGRMALFVVFFWFGILKVFGLSPANPLVAGLLNRTMPFIDFAHFIVFFGYFEMLIGILCLIPRLVRVSMLLLGMHMVMTMMPLVLLPAVAWSQAFVPTLEGQYIIKNLAIIAVAISIISQMPHPSEDVPNSTRVVRTQTTAAIGRK